MKNRETRERVRNTGTERERVKNRERETKGG